MTPAGLPDRVLVPHALYAWDRGRGQVPLDEADPARNAAFARKAPRLLKRRPGEVHADGLEPALGEEHRVRTAAAPQVEGTSGRQRLRRQHSRIHEPDQLLARPDLPGRPEPVHEVVDPRAHGLGCYRCAVARAQRCGAGSAATGPSELST